MTTTTIGRILEETGSIAFPGVFDTLSARIAQRTGFPMAFISGYSVAATTIGEPDMGAANPDRDGPAGPADL